MYYYSRNVLTNVLTFDMNVLLFQKFELIHYMEYHDTMLKSFTQKISDGAKNLQTYKDVLLPHKMPYVASFGGIYNSIQYDQAPDSSIQILS